MKNPWPRRIGLTALSAIMAWSMATYNDADPVATATTSAATASQGKDLDQIVLGDDMSEKTLAEQNADVAARLLDQPKGDDLYRVAEDGEYLVVTDAQSPRLNPSDNTGIAAIDPVTWAECNSNYDPAKAYWFKNKYNICRRQTVTIKFVVRNPTTGIWEEVGQVQFLLEFIGTAVNGAQRIDFRFHLLNFTESGTTFLGDHFRVQLPCLNADPDRTSTCATPTGSPSFYEMPVSEWWSRSGEDFVLTKEAATTAVPAEKHQSELRGFFAFGLQLTYFPSSGPEVEVLPDELFRCDVADYVAGSKCVFTNVGSVLQFRLSDTSLNESARFIQDAQTDITRTRPGVPGKVVPGGIGEIPLHRLYGIYDTENTYKATRRKVPKTCRRYYGVNYSQNRTRDCDEYPFASTYENAASVDTDTKYDYAVRPISASHNRTAGADYGAWLNADHILDGDPFWVKIVP